MAKNCEVCGKTKLKANKICFSHKAHTYRQKPNLQKIKVNVNGVAKRMNVCTSCIKANKIVKAS